MNGFFTWGRVRSSLKKLKTVWGETGSHNEVAALKTTPLGWPGSVGLGTVTRTPTSFKPESVVHRCPFDALILEQKLFIILSASFIMLLLPSGEGITRAFVEINHIWNTYNQNTREFWALWISTLRRPNKCTPDWGHHKYFGDIYNARGLK